MQNQCMVYSGHYSSKDMQMFDSPCIVSINCWLQEQGVRKICWNQDTHLEFSVLLHEHNNLLFYCRYSIEFFCCIQNQDLCITCLTYCMLLSLYSIKGASKLFSDLWIFSTGVMATSPFFLCHLPSNHGSHTTAHCEVPILSQERSLAAHRPFLTVPWHLSVGERHCHFLPSVPYFLF